jgi:hypothetical protein
MSQLTVTHPTQGAKCVACGPDGPEAWANAHQALEAWRSRNKGGAPLRLSAPVGTLARAFEEYRATPEWADKSPGTREEWVRCWARINPAFGTCRPSAVTLADFSKFRKKIENNVSLREAHRCIKIWRALWKVAAALKYCQLHGDPSVGVTNHEAKPRQAFWEHREVIRLVKTAWRAGYRGLVAVMAVTWERGKPEVAAPKTCSHSCLMAKLNGYEDKV